MARLCVFVSFVLLCFIFQFENILKHTTNSEFFCIEKYNSWEIVLSDITELIWIQRLSEKIYIIYTIFSIIITSFMTEVPVIEKPVETSLMKELTELLTEPRYNPSSTVFYLALNFTFLFHLYINTSYNNQNVNSSILFNFPLKYYHEILIIGV